MTGLVLVASAALAVALGPGAQARDPRSEPYDPLCAVAGDACDPPYVTSPTYGNKPAEPTTTTDDIARDKSRGAFTAVDLGKVVTRRGTPIKTAGIVGVDITLGDRDTPAYQVCFNVQDPYHGACSNTPNVGYVMVKNWYVGGKTNFGRGLIIGNSTDRDSCPAPCNHYWGQRSARIDVELYAKQSNGITDVKYVRPRFAQFSTDFTRHANGGTYGNAVGDVALLTVGEPGTASLVGTVNRSGVPVRSREVSLRLFQQDWSARATGGQRLQSFATPVTAEDGTYTTGALFTGRFFIRVIDSTSGECRELRNVLLNKVGIRMNFELTANGFGHGMTEC